MKNFLFLTFVNLFFATFGCKSDSVLKPLSQIENELKELQKTVFFSKKEEERFEANKSFIKLWESVLSQPQSMDYAFDSIREVSKLISADKKFRIITWNVPKNDGTQAYFGFIQVNNTIVRKSGLFKKSVSTNYELFSLADKSAAVKSPETHIGDHKKWFGMLYYAVIDCNGYYLLLGWDGNDKLTQKKFIDVLYFKSDGQPVFGRDVFKLPKKNPKRIMFEYSSEVAMSLKYNAGSNRIVFSHLAPKEEGSHLEGQYQYYGPDGSFDAYERVKNRWVLKEDIDARNPKSKNDNVKKPDPKKIKDLYKPK